MRSFGEAIKIGSRSVPHARIPGKLALGSSKEKRDARETPALNAQGDPANDYGITLRGAE